MKRIKLLHDLIYAGPNLAVHLSLLFSAMLRHLYVPSSFRYGIVKPILKNKYGDNTSIDMYRGITLTPVISRLFELVIYYCKKLNSLKHLVRTTVAESHK